MLGSLQVRQTTTDRMHAAASLSTGAPEDGRTAARAFSLVGYEACDKGEGPAGEQQVLALALG